MMTILFWICLIVVFYTYIGYGILLVIAVRIKELFIKNAKNKLPKKLPDVTLFITAYNEQEVVRKKMKNCLSLDYPKDKLHVVWVTDGCDDNTNELLNLYSDVKVYFQHKRKGKASAMNRGMNFIHTPIVVFTDANTLLNSKSIKEIIKCFTDPKVGCVSGEKHIIDRDRMMQQVEVKVFIGNTNHCLRIMIQDCIRLLEQPESCLQFAPIYMLLYVRILCLMILFYP